MNRNVERFYSLLMKNPKEVSKIQEELSKIQDEKGLMSFVDSKIIPIAKEKGFELTKEDLISYEKKAISKLSEEDLLNVSGGILLQCKKIISLFIIGINLSSNLQQMSYATKPGFSVMKEDQAKEQVNQEGNPNDSKEKVTEPSSISASNGLLLKQINNINPNLKWKLVIDGKCHKGGPDVFDKKRQEEYFVNHIKKTKTTNGERGYRDSMIDALNYVLSSECMEKKFDADLYLDIHIKACAKVKRNSSGRKMNSRTYRKRNVSFALTDGNYSEAGQAEFENKKNSSWTSDRLFAQADEGYDLALGKLGGSGIGNDYYDAPVIVDDEEAIKEAVDIIFNDYYSKLSELKNKGYIEESLLDRSATLEDKKLEIIIRICQNLDQLHAFEDGNIRTVSFLVLQRMLIENDLSPTIFNDPNCIDMKSVKEIMKELKYGQKTYLEVVEESCQTKLDK